MTKKIYLVTRNCCTSGKCINCKCGVPCRVAQFITFEILMAKSVCENFKGYDSKVEEATSEVLASLRDTSAQWVNDKLAHPEHINDRFFTTKPLH